MDAPGSTTARRRTDPMEILAEASEIVSGYTLDLDELLRQLAALVLKVVEYQALAVFLKSGKESLRIRFAIGYREEIVRNLRLGPAEGIVGAAAQKRQTVVVNDVTRDARYLMAIDATRSEIAVPLMARGKLVGVIDLQSPALDAFGEYERKLLELIASRFSLAIDGARAHRATMQRNRTLQTLSDIAQEFSHILHLEELLKKISSLVRVLIPYDAFSIFLLDEKAEMLEHYFGVRFDERMQLRSMPVGKGIVGAAATSAEPVLVRDTALDQRYVAAVEGVRSEVAVPLMLQHKVIGVLDLESQQVGAFSREHQRTLSLLAPQVAAAIENARLYEQVAASEALLERDLRAARELQKSLLPSACPSFEGVEIAARNDPALQVSGDLYDFFPFPPTHLGILIGDVSGKGAAAALYAALVAGLLRNQVRPDLSPAQLLEAADRGLLARRIEARYVTALYAQWYPQGRRLLLTNAGQPLPLIRRGGHVEYLAAAGVPLGLLEGASYDQTELLLEPGDLLLLASDGITETQSDFGEEYGIRRLREFVESHSDASANELLEAIFADVQAFSAGRRQRDDRTVIVVKVTG
jgi:sigma-B regulation protein RsbU (phosphoserine phosphatase)